MASFDDAGWTALNGTPTEGAQFDALG